jgi:hypothetical protein
MEPTVLVSALEPGDLFDDALPGEAPSRDRAYRVVGVRTKTVLVENAVGIRRSFSREADRRVQRLDPATWQQLVSTKPAAPAQVKKEAEGGAAEVA